MRMAIGAGFGLVSLLVVMYIIAHMAASYLPAVSQSNAVARSEAEQFSGRDSQGKPVEQTYDLFADMSQSSGKVRDFRVSRLDPGSPMGTRFGLKVGDLIVAATGEGGFRTDFNASDEQASRDAVRDAYVYNGQLFVQRGSELIQLPGGQAANIPGIVLPQNAPTAPSATASPQQPATAQPRTAQDPPVNHDESGTMDQINGRLHTVPGM